MTYDPLQLKLRGIGKVGTVIKTHVITLSLKWISTNFPNLLLLLFLIVLALPNDSRRGFAKIKIIYYNIVIYNYIDIQEEALLGLPSTILCSMIPALAPYDSVRYLSSAEITYRAYYHKPPTHDM